MVEKLESKDRDLAALNTNNKIVEDDDNTQQPFLQQKSKGSFLQISSFILYHVLFFPTFFLFISRVPDIHGK